MKSDRSMWESPRLGVVAVDGMLLAPCRTALPGFLILGLASVA